MGAKPDNKLEYIWDHCRVWDVPHNQTELDELRDRARRGLDPIERRIVNWMADGGKGKNKSQKSRNMSEDSYTPSVKRNKTTPRQDNATHPASADRASDDQSSDSASLCRFAGTLQDSTPVRQLHEPVPATPLTISNLARASNTTTDAEASSSTTKPLDCRDQESDKEVRPQLRPQVLPSLQAAARSHVTDTQALPQWIKSPSTVSQDVVTDAMARMALLGRTCPGSLCGHQCRSPTCDKRQICLVSPKPMSSCPECSMLITS